MAATAKPAKTTSTATIQKLTQELAINRAMADNSPINILLADTDLNITYVNPASLRTLKTLENFLPCKAEEVLGKNVDAFHKDPSYQRRILSNERNLPKRAIIQIGDQKADLLVTPVFDSAGKYLGPMVTWEVVTEKVEMESKSLDYARQIAAISESQAVIEFTMDGTIVTANANFTKTVGYTLDEIKGQHHSMFAEPVFARSPEYKAFWTKLNRGESDEGQYMRVGKGGREIWLQARYNVLVNEAGKPYKVVKYANDITERRKLEERAADYIRQIEAISAAQAVIEFKMDGTIVDANANFLSAMGYRIEEIRGQHHSMFALPAFAASAEYKAFWVKLNRGESDEGRYLRVGKGGKEVWIQARYSALIDNNGKPYKVVKYASDITDQVRMEQDQKANVERERQAQEDLRRKVEELMTVVSASANGDLTKDVTFTGEDAMGKLADGFRKMLKDLRAIISQVVDGASQFAEGSQVIAEGSQRLASGAQTQSASVEEMSASIEELTRSIEAVKDNASAANKLAIQTNKMAEEGGQAVQKSVEAMDLIKNSSEQISEIIQVISEIASQTNLLALNAAIEAARAGEHGLGFAVVADEVRKLAERSSEAAKEISKLIKESTQRVSDGAKLSEETGKALEKIIQGVEATTNKISEIATSTVEQAQNANEVANAIQQVSTVTEQSAAASEEMASSSEQLGAQAGSLRDLVKRFKVE